MMKKLFALLLAAVMLLGAGATALAAEPEGAGYVISIANSSTTNSLTVDLLTWEGMKNGRLELTYPEELTLVSARSTLDAGAGITDLDASKPGTVHFAWAAYTAQKDGTPVLRLTFRGQHGKTYFWNVIDTETGWQSKSMLPFDYRFNDVLDENAWYYDAVYAAWDAGLMNGVGNGMFEPESSMTRAMLVTVLWRYAGSPAGWENPFTDVPNGSWFTQAVAWAAENGIVNGVGNNKFEPDSNITREQMAAILFRYAQKVGAASAERADLSGFPDANAVSDYASDAMRWVVAEGIIGGSREYDGRDWLKPQGSATRAQVAAILMRYIENVTK